MLYLTDNEKARIARAERAEDEREKRERLLLPYCRCSIAAAS